MNVGVNADATDASLRVAWQRFRVLRALVLTLWIGWLPFGIFVMNASERVLSRRAGFVAVIVYSVLFAAAGLALQAWRCPRCGKPFVWNSAVRRRFAWPASCAHCGLEVGDHLASS